VNLPLPAQLALAFLFGFVVTTVVLTLYDMAAGEPGTLPRPPFHPREGVLFFVPFEIVALKLAAGAVDGAVPKLGGPGEAPG
jgi:hypothetical protein